MCIKLKFLNISNCYCRIPLVNTITLVSSRQRSQLSASIYIFARHKLITRLQKMVQSHFAEAMSLLTATTENSTVGTIGAFNELDSVCRTVKKVVNHKDICLLLLNNSNGS